MFCLRSIMPMICFLVVVAASLNLSRRPQAVYLVAATNRPDMIDPALLRPGRLDKILYVPLPAADGRSSILATLTRKTPMAHDVDLGEVAGLAQGFSGADMAALVREACIKAMREALGTEPMTEIDEQDRGLLSMPLCLSFPSIAVVVHPFRVLTAAGHSLRFPFPEPLATLSPSAAVVEQRHFLAALSTINPSVSPKDQRVYNALRNKLKSSRGRLASTAPTEAENLMPTPMEGASSDAAGLNPGEDVNPMDSA